jgi:hypothetical protein
MQYIFSKLDFWSYPLDKIRHLNNVLISSVEGSSNDALQGDMTLASKHKALLDNFVHTPSAGIHPTARKAPIGIEGIC